MILRAFALLVIASLATPVLAGDKPEGKKGPGKGGPGADWDKLVKKLDKDGDGQISKDELAAAKAEHEKKGEEPKGDEPKKPEGKKGAGKHAGPGSGPLAKHFDEIDANKDGKISKDEFKAFTDAMKEKAKDKKGEKGAKPAEPKKADEPAPKAEEPPPVK